ncbi:malonyl-CoA decarboxylase-domain-containing protein [Parasitella parasitica]|nr:malonyl-CoA decarboxylase-domain-containing protein [Parasitella parasitica]
MFKKGLFLQKHFFSTVQIIRRKHFNIETAATTTPLPKVFNTNSDRQSEKTCNRLFVQELLQRITEDTNSLPPPLFTEKCCKFYKQLDRAGKLEFFDVLSKEFDVDRENAVKKAKEYLVAGRDRSDTFQVEKSLQHILEPRYNVFLDRVHQLPNGLKCLADMRADLLDMMGSRGSPAYNKFSSLEQNIRLKLKRYVIGFLKLERITWEQSSASLLEKICLYEAVHQVRDWKDIKRRLGLDRRVYAFFENNTPDEPLVFVHVALLPTMANSVQAILNAPCPAESDLDASEFKYAICYSITTQHGLGGINLGNYLIKQALDDLQREFPLLKVFATLSPMPGYRQWLWDHIDSDNTVQAEFDHVQDWKHKLNRFSREDQEELKAPLMRLCSRYILSEKQASNNALDPVANFHLRNGACAHQIHWQADTSEKGIRDSFGIMINYNYITDRLESNHRLYQKNGTISVSSEPAGDKQETSWLSQWVTEKQR